MAAGLAASTKYNGGVVFLPLLGAAFCGWRALPEAARMSGGRWGLGIGVAALLVGMTFLLGTPYALLDFPHFWAQFQDEWQHAQETRTLDFQGTPPGWVYYLQFGFPAGLGVIGAWGALMGVGAALIRREPGDVLLLGWVGLFYLMVGAAQDHFIRYLIPLLPALSVLTARWLWQAGRGAGIKRWVGGGVAAVILLSAGMKSVAYLQLLDSRDSRTEVARWFRQTVPSGTRVGLSDWPWFYTPPLVPANGGGAPRAQDLFTRDPASQRYDWVWLNFRAEVLNREAPEWVILTDFEYGSRVRLGQAAALSFMAQLEQDYLLQQRHYRPPSCGGFLFDRGPVPHDWRYLNPEIRVYRRRH